MPNYLLLSEIKRRLRISFDDDDAELAGHLRAAESYLGDPVDGVLQRQVVRASFVETFNSFSDVCLEWPDNVSDVFVTYVDGDGATQTLGSIYTVSDGRLELNYEKTWPAPAENVIVSYSSGWDAADIPAGISDIGYFIAQTFYDLGVEVDYDRLRKIVAFKAAPFRRSGI
ncbi:MAG: head-tail connector protein [Pikeienuella sp.]